MTLFTPVTRSLLGVLLALGILALALSMLWWPWSALLIVAGGLAYGGIRLLVSVQDRLDSTWLFAIAGLLVIALGLWLAFGADLLWQMWEGLPDFPAIVRLLATVLFGGLGLWLIWQYKYLMPLFWVVPQEWQPSRQPAGDEDTGEVEAQATTDGPPIPLGKERTFQTFLRAVLGGARNWTRADGMKVGFTRPEWEAIDRWFRSYSLSSFKGGLTDEGKRYARDWLSQYYQDIERVRVQ